MLLKSSLLILEASCPRGMRTSRTKLHPSLAKEIKRNLFQVLLDLKSNKEIETFLQDFFTSGELETFSKRLAIAYWLKKGRSYENIRKNLKVSSATIASVQSLMETQGLKLALKKIEAEEWAAQWAKRIQKIVKK